MQELAMNLEPIFKRFSVSTGGAPAPVGLVGAGEFGATFVAQARRMQALRVAAICDQNLQRAQAAAHGAGFDSSQVQVCADLPEAARAHAQGRVVVVDSAQLLAQLPTAAVLEATGDPQAAAATARTCLEAGRHVVLATKEAEIVVGPELARVATDHGVVCAPVDGDQPSLLIGLVEWARLLGLPVVAAGKSSESDFVWNPADHSITAWGRNTTAPDFGGLFAPTPADQPGGWGSTLAARRGLPFDMTTVPDLCEMGIVANHTGLLPDCESLHAPLARTVELPSIFRPRAHGGVLNRPGRVDMFNCLRRPDELSFAGGVFVVIEAPDLATGRLFAAKGMPTCAEGRYVLIHNPVHLLGVEAAMSMLAAVQLGCSTGGSQVRPVVDLIGLAQRDLEVGEALQIGVRHVIDGLQHVLRPAQALGDDAPLPYYMAAGTRLVRRVPAGQPLRCGDVAMDSTGALSRLRKAQDEHFLARQASA
jgi:predicted homoserine dehydrogenase-like protein